MVSGVNFPLNQSNQPMVYVRCNYGAPSRARVQLPNINALNSMVSGRYNELVNGSFAMVCKPTYNWGPILYDDMI